MSVCRQPRYIYGVTGHEGEGENLHRPGRGDGAPGLLSPGTPPCRGRSGAWREQDACQNQVCCSPPVPGHRPAAQCVRLDAPQPPPRFLPWEDKGVGTKAAPARRQKPGFQKPAACVSHGICRTWAEKEERYLTTVLWRRVFIPGNPRDSWRRRV